MGHTLPRGFYLCSCHKISPSISRQGHSICIFASSHMWFFIILLLYKRSKLVILICGKIRICMKIIIENRTQWWGIQPVIVSAQPINMCSQASAETIESMIVYFEPVSVGADKIMRNYDLHRPSLLIKTKYVMEMNNDRCSHCWTRFKAQTSEQTFALFQNSHVVFKQFFWTISVSEEINSPILRILNYSTDPVLHYEEIHQADRMHLAYLICGKL